MNILQIGGRRWYRTLVGPNSLGSHYDNSTIAKSIVVCYMLQKTRYFSIFKDYIDVYSLREQLDVPQRCFFEIIYGHVSQKPYFDVDMGDIDIETATAIVNNLIDAIEKELTIDRSKDILVYSSNSEEKKSYHVVVNNYCVADNLQNRQFYTNVMRHVPEDNHKYIDSSMYSVKQQLRMLGSQKPGSGRVKVFEESWFDIDHVYEEGINDRTKELEQLAESLVTYTDRCRCIPNLIPIPEKPKYTGTSEEDPLTEEDVLKALALLSDEWKFEKIVDVFIILKRTRPSYCNICERVHESENAFLTIRNRNVYFYCRRSDKAYSLIGDVNVWMTQESAEQTTPKEPTPLPVINKDQFWSYALGDSIEEKTTGTTAIVIPENKFEEPLDPHDIIGNYVKSVIVPRSSSIADLETDIADRMRRECREAKTANKKPQVALMDTTSFWALTFYST